MQVEEGAALESECPCESDNNSQLKVHYEFPVNQTKTLLMNRQLAKLVPIALCLLPVSAQNPPSTAPPDDTLPPTADPVQVIGFLSKAISWHRQLAVEQQLASEPADLTFVQENRRVADQVVPLAFDFARQQADARAKQRPQQAQQPENQAPQQYQRLMQAAQKTEQQLQDTQRELQSTREKLAHARLAQRSLIQAQVSELESEVALLRARSDALQNMLEFVNTSNAGMSGVGLRAQIEELARSVPAALSHPQGTSPREPEQPGTAPGNSASRKSEPTGIWGLISGVLRLSGKMHSLEDEIHGTADLSRDARALRQPLLDHMRSLIHQGEVLFAAADTATPDQLAKQKQQLDALTAEFKQTSAAMLPLSKTSVLLDTYQRTLDSWRESIRDDLNDDLRQLLFRLAVLAVLIGIVMGIGEIWRRTTFRYVHDARRRYQFLLIRRIVIWITIAIIIIFTFASQLGSAVTFAGLLTAGIAVALQNVIVSIVAYFFLIGKYGIRVGDRVQIADVTGEVVELGLVRIHLMELEGRGNSQPTGRTVAFSNSIVFQPTSGVFKQIPGTSFIWHELKLALAPDTEYQAARERITQAVESALAGYRESMDAQREVMARNLASVVPAELRPRVRLHYSAAGIEATVTFPVDIHKASEMDDHVMKEIIASLGRDPKIKLVGAEIPSAKAGD
jgi:hypothetical protein